VIRTRFLLMVLIALASMSACADDDAERSLQPGLGVEFTDATSGPEGSTTTESTTTTLALIPCSPPRPLPDGSDPRVVEAHGLISNLAGDAVGLADAISASGFGSGWADEAPVGGALYDLQVSLYELADTLQRRFQDAGATYADGWSFPAGDLTLEPLGAPWMAVLEFQAVTLPELLAAPSRDAAQALLDAGALCGLVDAFTAGLDTIAAGG
jgi:hypothetical protein